MSYVFPEAPPDTLELLANVTGGQLMAGVALEAPFHDFIFPTRLWKHACHPTVGKLGEFPAITFKELQQTLAPEPRPTSFIDLRSCCLMVEQDLTLLPGWQPVSEVNFDEGLSIDWQKYWIQDKNGNLKHQSGILVVFDYHFRYWGRALLFPESSTLAIYRARESSKGITEPMLSVKLAKLIKEAWLWKEFCGNDR